jgi:hypothetical protein
MSSAHSISVSNSWEQLRPHRNFDRFDESDETSQEYVARLSPRYDIPFEVADQWLYPHYCRSETVSNYAWIDFQPLSFECVELDSEIVSELYVIEQYRSFVTDRATNREYSQFTCLERDLAHWKKESTWRVPPVILDVASIGVPPQHADIKGPLQLIEGHSRLGNFLALKSTGKLRERKHRVYMLSRKIRK